MEFEGKIVLITGAGGGIGSAIAQKFYEEGALLALVDLKEEYALKTINRYGFSEVRAHAYEADISQEESVKELISTILNDYPTIDICINCAGIQCTQNRVEKYSFENFKKEYSVNVFGTFLMIQNVLPIMQKQKDGVILNFGSVSGMFGYPYEIGYGSSKWAIIGMTKNVANENGAKTGVRINSVSPGWVNTSMYQNCLKEYKQQGYQDPMDEVTLGPLNRPAETSEIADVVIGICSKRSGIINGANILADGGMTLG